MKLTPHERSALIKKIKGKAPKILRTVVSEMGYEFSAISSKGYIFREVGMMLATETDGHLPEFLRDDTMSEAELSKKLEIFFENNLDIVPYEELDDEVLINLPSEM